MLADLLGVCILLQLSSICAGWAPLFVLSPARRRWVSTVGVGALIGTAFVVVIPEGVHTMYQPPRPPHTYGHVANLPQPVEPLASGGGGGAGAGDDSLAWTKPLTSVINTGDDPDDWQSPMNQFKGTPASNAQIVHKATPEEEAAHAHAHEHSDAGHTHGGRRLLADAGHARSDAAVVAPARSSAPQAQQLYTEAASSAIVDALPLIVCFGETHASKLMGALLALGFVAMLLVDRFVGRSSVPEYVILPPDLEQAPLLSSSISSSRNSEGVELQSRLGKSASMSAGSSGGGERSNVSGSISTTASPNGMRELSGSGGGGGGGSGATGSSGGTPRLPANKDRSNPTPTSSNHHLTFPTHAHPMQSPSTLAMAAAAAAAAAVGSGSGSAHHRNASVAASSASQRSLLQDINVLLGVFVYAALDGFFIGTQAVGSRGPSRSWVALALSMVLHRAPLSFGVACFLMYQSRPPTAIRRLVLAFSCVGPLSALCAVSILGAGDILSEPGGYGILGLGVLFAGGAMLFSIAVHILPEIQRQNGGHAVSSSRALDEAHGHGSGADSVALLSSPMAATLGSPASMSPSGVSSSARMASPPSRHEDHSLLASMHRDHAHGSSSSGLAGAGDVPQSMPWRHVWALILGLLLPLAAAWIMPRKELL